MSGSLVHSPAHIISKLLIDLSLGTEPSDDGAWPVRYGNEADKPDNVITVLEAAGLDQGRTQIDGERQERHGFRVQIRATSDAVGYLKARAIAVALDKSVRLTSVTVSSNTYLIYAISRSGDILSFGKDHETTNLNLFTINATASLRQTS